MITCWFRLQGLEEGLISGREEREPRSGPPFISSEARVGEIQDIMEGVCVGFPGRARMCFRGKVVKVVTSFSNCAGSSLASRCVYHQ